MATVNFVNPVFNRSGNHSFDFSAISETPVIDVGKVLNNPKDRLVKVGDIIYLTISFRADNVSKSTNGQHLPSFFVFYSPADDKELKVKYIFDAASPILIPNGEGDDVILECLLDLADLASGEKVIQLRGFDKEPGKIREVLLAESDPFYVQQSLAEFMQPNIANQGISDETGLNRDRINNPTYFPVGLQPVNPLYTKDVKLWEAIRDATEALSFRNYYDFMNVIFCGEDIPIDHESQFQKELKRLKKRRKLPFNDTDAYRSIKIATEAFVMVNLANSTGDLSGYLQTVSDSNGEVLQIIPYLAIIRNKLSDIDFKSTSFEDALSNFIDSSNGRVADTCFGIISERIQQPIYLELIWSYWHEESMMVQGVNTIARRFQNIKGEGAVDPLANLEVGPLRPLSNLMWGYIQDEQHRLTVRRRAYEYDHHYGITLQGKAVSNMRTADSRSKFIEAFHMLMNLCMKFYRQYDDTTVVADGFPIMNALKEVHMILSEGAHNQYGDLPSTARIEMLMQQYLLARPEFREFLPTRQMVPYPEAWMDRAAVLNQLHGWTKTSVLHFRDLGVFGEQILLSIRFGAWSTVFNRDQAANWAIFWRPQIQNYMHAYRAVTGVDLTREDGAVIDAQQPSTHLLRRLKEQKTAR
ncbi:hypothetical protein D3H65_17350 [Paraflavitalea soli]|uniref:8-amino-7-oxononanoate synthase n=1 Tax=Paraflavitalea soli TaxID=2315862 RepID=A0A3B7MQK6_9BACT|nr:hypothetical protein [Paraflavitalea soli]AXY75633.1 hypothetical protein D3H65_17350 [Paraflavitalea soli]